MIVLVSLIVLAVLAGGAARRAGRLLGQLGTVRPEVSRLTEQLAALQSAAGGISRR